MFSIINSYDKMDASMEKTEDYAECMARDDEERVEDQVEERVEDQVDISPFVDEGAVVPVAGDDVTGYPLDYLPQEVSVEEFHGSERMEEDVTVPQEDKPVVDDDLVSETQLSTKEPFRKVQDRAMPDKQAGTTARLTPAGPAKRTINELIRNHKGQYAEIRFTIPHSKLLNFTEFINQVNTAGESVFKNRIVLENIYDKGEIVKSSRPSEREPMRRLVTFVHHNLLSFPTGPNTSQRVSMEICRNIRVDPGELKILRNKTYYTVRYHEREFRLSNIGATLFIRTASNLKPGSQRIRIQEKIDAIEEAHYRLSVYFDKDLTPFTTGPVKTNASLKGRFRQLLEPMEHKFFDPPVMRLNISRVNELASRYNRIRLRIDEQSDLFYQFIKWIDEIKEDYEKTCDNDDDAIKISTRLDHVRSDQKKLEHSINAIMTEIESLGIYGNLIDDPVMLVRSPSCRVASPSPRSPLPIPSHPSVTAPTRFTREPIITEVEEPDVPEAPRMRQVPIPPTEEPTPGYWDRISAFGENVGTVIKTRGQQFLGMFAKMGKRQRVENYPSISITPPPAVVNREAMDRLISTVEKAPDSNYLTVPGTSSSVNLAPGKWISESSPNFVAEAA